MLTVKKPNGEWYVKGVDFKDCTGNMYGALCKLRDYEATGLEPDDFRGDSYEKKYLYKVFYESPYEHKKTVYCESKEDAEEIARLLYKDGYDAEIDTYDYQALIEK